MNDSINRQAALDAINDICPVDTEYDCVLLDRVEVRYVLWSLPSADGKWTPVTEAKPESEGVYLVSGRDKVWLCKFSKMQLIQGWENDARNPMVEAWMPLPKPWKGERNG